MTGVPPAIWKHVIPGTPHLQIHDVPFSPPLSSPRRRKRPHTRSVPRHAATPTQYISTFCRIYGLPSAPRFDEQEHTTYHRLMTARGMPQTSEDHISSHRLLHREGTPVHTPPGKTVAT